MLVIDQNRKVGTTIQRASLWRCDIGITIWDRTRDRIRSLSLSPAAFSSIGWLPMFVPLLCVGTGRLLILASVSDAGLFLGGQARLMFRRYFALVQLRVFDQFGSRVVSGEVGGRRQFGGWIAGFRDVSNQLHTYARRANVSAHSRICARNRLHQPKQEKERQSRERQ
jgi:hypothetical protein